MVARVSSSTLIGIDAVRVDIESEIISSLKRFAIVGLPDGVVREAKDRVRCAIESSGFPFPFGEVVVNLSPAGLPKSGSGFDLAIALSILGAAGLIPAHTLKKCIVLGELALDGTIKPVPSILAAACLVRNLSGFELLVPEDSAEALRNMNGLRARTAKSLGEAALHFLQKSELPLVDCDAVPMATAPSHLDFSDVVGQQTAKRVLEIVAAGGHNLLMVGPPGSGKSMLAARVPSILPPLAPEEQIEVSKIYAAYAHSGGSSQTRSSLSLIRKRPFRAPHYSLSTPGLIGGGSVPIPGEISLAHRGVLFLDEVTEVRRDAIEALRQPLETKRVTISRAKFRVQFPADFVFLAAMNPCPCGRKGAKGGEGEICRCGPTAVAKYLGRLSGPIIDRIDLQIWVPAVPIREIQSGPIDDPTAGMRERVGIARKIQSERFGGDHRVNARLRPGEIKKYCALDESGMKLLEEAAEKYHLSARGYTRVLKVARTVVDLEQTEQIRTEHLREVLSYRLNLG